MPHAKPGDKRKNKAVDLADAVSGAIGPVLAKRGFASRDLLTNWQAIAPVPYNTQAIPHQLIWPRSQAGAEGAILFVRCAEGQKLALTHEAPAIAAAINRYFGYVLVGAVKLVSEPFTPRSGPGTETEPDKPGPRAAELEQALTGVENEDLRDALRRLGEGVMHKSKDRQRSP